jgi:restriction system protein
MRWLGFSDGSAGTSEPGVAAVSAWVYEDRDDWTDDRIRGRRQELERQIRQLRAQQPVTPSYLLAELRWCDEELADAAADQERRVPMSPPAPMTQGTTSPVPAAQDERMPKYVSVLKRMAADLAHGHYLEYDRWTQEDLANQLRDHPDFPRALTDEVEEGVRRVKECKRLLEERAEAQLAPLKAELSVAAAAADKARTTLWSGPVAIAQAESVLATLQDLLEQAESVRRTLGADVAHVVERAVSDARFSATGLDVTLCEVLRPVDAPVYAAPVETADPFAHMDRGQFEEAIADLLRRDGHHAVERCGNTGDLGADVTAVTAFGSKIVVQCKRYDPKSRVGSEDIQKFGGTCFAIHHAELALFVTTASFTAPAQALADRLRIVTIDGQALERWRAGEYEPTEGL